MPSSPVVLHHAARFNTTFTPSSVAHVALGFVLSDLLLTRTSKMWQHTALKDLINTTRLTAVKSNSMWIILFSGLPLVLPVLALVTLIFICMNRFVSKYWSYGCSAVMVQRSCP